MKRRRSTETCINSFINNFLVSSVNDLCYHNLMLLVCEDMRGMGMLSISYRGLLSLSLSLFPKYNYEVQYNNFARGWKRTEEAELL